MIGLDTHERQGPEQHRWHRTAIVVGQGAGCLMAREKL
jgi:hypothetical protein